MDQSAVLGLPYIMPSQAQKHVTHNEALRALDAIVQVGVDSAGTATPPAVPEEGMRFIVPNGGLSEWAGQDGQIAVWETPAWSFYAPRAGWLAWIADEARLVVWNGTSWQSAASANPVPEIGINTLADSVNRLAVKSDSVLLSHDDITPGSGDVRLTVNKATSGGAASVVFQTGYSGRAEFGTTGDDSWRVKVSADGTTWHEALVADNGTGFVGLGTSTPSTRLHVDGPARVGGYTVASAPDAAAAGAGAIIFVSDEAGGPILAFSDGSTWRRVTDRAAIA